jgi:hypothetical protein
MKKLVIALCFALAVACQAQITSSTSCTQNIGSTNVTGTCTLTSVSANSLVLVGILLDDMGGTFTINAPTATGLTFTAATTVLNQTGNAYLQIWCGYTSSALGSTVVTQTWTPVTSIVLIVNTFTGTQSSCATALGNTNSASQAGTGTSISTTVTSSGTNNSKYYGFLGNVATAAATNTPGSGFTALTNPGFNTNSDAGMTELSTSPVSPAANTAVSASTSAGQFGLMLWGIEIKAAGGAPAPVPMMSFVAKLEDHVLFPPTQSK